MIFFEFSVRIKWDGRVSDSVSSFFAHELSLFLRSLVLLLGCVKFWLVLQFVRDMLPTKVCFILVCIHSI